MGDHIMYYVPYQLVPVRPNEASGLAPQGFLGGALGSLLGGAVGGLFGGSGSSIGSTLGGVAGGFLPFSSGPTFAVAGAEPAAASKETPQAVLLPQSYLNPTVAAQRNLLQSAAKGFIDQLVTYLKKNESSSDQLSEVVPLVTRAAELYKASDFERSALQAFLAFHTLETIRAKHPALLAVFS
jgi:hypothetical protein